MTSLRQQMINQMTLRGFSEKTHQSYLIQVRGVARYYHRSPDQLTPDELQRYVLYLIQDKQLSFSSCRQFVHAIRFLFQQVLKRRLEYLDLPHPKKEQKIPDLLYPDEVRAILSCCKHLKYQTGIALAYGTGMRLGEVRNLQVTDFDGSHDQIKVRQGKGNKDRYVAFSESLKHQLRRYWRHYHPESYVLYGLYKDHPVSEKSLRVSLKQAAMLAGVQKNVRFHSLRHAYATHQLQAGMPLTRLQMLLGHRELRTTLHYIHWVATMSGARLSAEDLLRDWRAEQ